MEKAEAVSPEPFMPREGTLAIYMDAVMPIEQMRMMPSDDINLAVF